MKHPTIDKALKLLTHIKEFGIPENRWLPTFIHQLSMESDLDAHRVMKDAIDGAAKKQFWNESTFLRQVIECVHFASHTLGHKSSDPFAVTLREVTLLWAGRGYDNEKGRMKDAAKRIAEALQGHDAAQVLKDWVETEKHNWLAILHNSDCPSAEKFRNMYADLISAVKAVN